METGDGIQRKDGLEGAGEGVDAALGETAQVNGVLLDVLGGPIGEGNVEREGAEPFPLLLLQPRLFGQFGGAGVIAGGQGLFLKGIAEGEIDGDGGEADLLHGARKGAVVEGLSRGKGQGGGVVFQVEGQVPGPLHQRDGPLFILARHRTVGAQIPQGQGHPSRGQGIVWAGDGK